MMCTWFQIEKNGYLFENWNIVEIFLICVQGKLFNDTA